MAHLLWHDLTESAKRFPSRPAVAGPHGGLTYRELDEQSTRLAHLLAADGIGRRTRVGIHLPKQPEAIVAMLGVLKTGAAYVPVDPGAPPARIATIFKDCAVSGLISTARQLARLGEALGELGSLKTVVVAGGGGEPLPRWPAARAEIPPRVHAWTELDQVTIDGGAVPAGGAEGVETDPAYLLYTSGSTGKPKGVVLSHRNALAFVEWGAATFAVEPEDKLSNHAPHHFDLSVFDIYVALRCGACVSLVPDQVAPFPMELASWIENTGITVWYSVPSALVRLLLHGKMERFAYRKLRTVLYAGEVFPIKYLREVMARLPCAAFHNLYGPTETNVCTYYSVPRTLGPEATEIPVGKACANTEVFALNDSGQPIGPGGTGELYVRGPTVMLGYWGLPEKTREVLTANPLESAFYDPAYRTGDLVRLEADGNYYFLGRRDHMVKSRGYRIELGEIEQALYRHPGVREAVVLAIPDEEVGGRLKAVVVPHAAGSLTPEELTAFCRERVPKYMVPEEFVLLSELPRTSTGKADRTVLAESLDPAREEARRS